MITGLIGFGIVAAGGPVLASLVPLLVAVVVPIVYSFVHYKAARTAWGLVVDHREKKWGHLSETWRARSCVPLPCLRAGRHGGWLGSVFGPRSNPARKDRGPKTDPSHPDRKSGISIGASWRGSRPVWWPWSRACGSSS